MRYDVPTLNSKTSKEDQAKLVAALEAVPGVAEATLQLSSRQFEITAKDQQHSPKREDIAAAASKAGFALASKK